MDNTVSCSTSALLDTWSSHNWSEGVQLEKLHDMSALTVHTENTRYDITVISGQTGDILIRGGRFFPEFTEAKLAGCSLGGSFLKLRGVYIGFSLEVHFEKQLIVTSRIQRIALGSR